MKFLANENFPKASVLLLRQNGFDIVSIGVENFGITDVEVIDFSNREERTILTFDRDYGELIFRFNMRPLKGVVFFRLNEFAPEEPGRLLMQWLNRNNNFIAENTLSVLERFIIRQVEY